MPVNYEQIHNQIKILGQHAPEHFKALSSRRKKASDWLQAAAANPERTKTKIEDYLQAYPGYRCAMPGTEPILKAFSSTQIPSKYVLFTADGSQITPSHHDAVEFGVVNIGIFRYSPLEPPSEFTQSELLYFDAIVTDSGLVDEDYISLQRDVKEREILLDLAAAEKQKVITLTDGPLEIYSEPKSGLTETFNKYLAALHQLAKLKTATAGFVDKPRADLVVCMLEIAPPGVQESSVGSRPLAGVSDAGLFAEFLSPGERSAIFSLHSSSSKYFTDEIALNFFYLNVGRANHPHLARVEIPAWVVADPASVNLVQALLLEQSAQLGSTPYPYALHRAHEIAVVEFEEKGQIESLISAELLKQGIDLMEKSGKQSAKDLPGKKRYGE